MATSSPWFLGAANTRSAPVARPAICAVVAPCPCFATACTLAARIAGHGIAVRHEEFDDGHMNIPYRYDVSLPFLAAGG
jgi:hypothetical protein